MKEQVMARFHELKQRAAELYPHITKKHQFKKVKVTFVPKCKGAMALAYRASNLIEIGMDYLESDFEYMVDQVIGHELVHIIAPLLHGDKGWGHTPAWKKVMSEMGLVPEK